MHEASTGDVVVARVDGYPGDQLRTLAQDLQHRGRRVVVLAGEHDDKVAVAVASDGSLDAASTVKSLAAHVGGGGGGSERLALAGGRDAKRHRRGARRGEGALSTEWRGSSASTPARSAVGSPSPIRRTRWPFLDRRSRTTTQLIESLRALVDEEGVTTIVVGRPVALSGNETAARTKPTNLFTRVVGRLSARWSDSGTNG